MDKDLQKPILYKADPWVFAQVEKWKEKKGYLKRNRIINDAMKLYLEAVEKLTGIEELNDITWNQPQIQRFLFNRMKEIQRKFR